MNKILNFEIPASEIEAFIANGESATLATHLKYLDETPEDFPIDDGDDIFPNTFLIEAMAIRGWARLNKIPIESLYSFDSEGDSDPKYPKFGDIIRAWWGFGEDEGEEIPNVNFKELDAYFEYAWPIHQAITFYEITINNKLALAIDCSDGTSGTHFSMVTLIFQK